MRLILTADVNELGKRGDVVEGIKRFTGIELDRSDIEIPRPIKSIGLHEVTIKPHPEVEFPLTLDVIPA